MFSSGQAPLLAEQIYSDLHTKGYYRGPIIDPSAETLSALVHTLGTPHRHDLSDRFVWDIKPTRHDPSEAARSHTSLAFPLHTDCSYETHVPNGVALLTIRVDRDGGGISELLDTQPLLAKASARLKSVLATPFPIAVPKEFFKGCAQIYAPILSSKGELRYREDLFMPELMSEEQKRALEELRCLFASSPKTTFSLAEGEVLLIDNTRMLHGRSVIKDPARHLLRMRFHRAEHSAFIALAS